MKTYCINCGVVHSQDNFPKKCQSCNHEMYVNPIPVAVVLIPVIGEGILLIQRGIEPQIGQYALPGGFVDANESAEMAAIREVKEEVGLTISSVELIAVKSPPNNRTLLVFYKSNPVKLSDINFVPNSEVTAIKIVKEPTQLGFPIHSEILKLVLSNPNYYK
jgi:NADH pyrophosphatase NudC (nudix superfamily)